MVVDDCGNCHEYCQYSRYCNAVGEINKNKFSCPNFNRFDSIADDFKYDDYDDPDYDYEEEDE